MTHSLRGQTVLVIGAGGIGAAAAARVREEGARAFVASRSARAPRGTEALTVDVCDVDALKAALGGVGTIDHLVHTAAARSPSVELAQLANDSLEVTFATKLFSAVHLVRLALPHLAERASITLTSGQVSRKYGTGSFLKGSVNAAVDALGKHLAKELAPRRVNVVSPGVVDTDLWGAPGAQSREAVMARAASLPVGRPGAPEDLADAYLFVMVNGFVTGAVIDVDGGGLL